MTHIFLLLLFSICFNRCNASELTIINIQPPSSANASPAPYSPTPAASSQRYDVTDGKTPSPKLSPSKIQLYSEKKKDKEKTASHLIRIEARPQSSSLIRRLIIGTLIGTAIIGTGVGIATSYIQPQNCMAVKAACTPGCNFNFGNDNCLSTAPAITQQLAPACAGNFTLSTQPIVCPSFDGSCNNFDINQANKTMRAGCARRRR